MSRWWQFSPGRTGRRDVAGFRLGTKLTLLVLTLTLLLVPWLSVLALDEVGRALRQMQSHHQLLTAKNVATFFNGREDLFTDLPVDPSDYETLFAEPVEGPVRLDGRIEDWGDVPAGRAFGVAGSDGSFLLSLAARGAMLYAFVEVIDDVRVFRDPEFLRLDNADQLRLSFVRPNGDDGRITVTLSESGATTAYSVDEDWRFADIGPPETRVQGFVRKTDDGYALELRAPFELFGTSLAGDAGGVRVFGVSFVDVDDETSRSIRTITHTLPTTRDQENFGLVALRSPDTLKVLEGLAYADVHIRVIDAQQRVRAETGSYRTITTPAPSWEVRTLGWLDRLRTSLGELLPGDPLPTSDTALADVMASALTGNPMALRRQAGGAETIIAGHPIISAGQIIGLIVVEQNIDDILLFQRESLGQIAVVAVASFVVVLVCLIVFAGRLTWRIGRLRRETGDAIDDLGRLRTDAVASEIGSGDEIGDLARSVSGMLGRLSQHHTFLQRMPRTLRHEINNPLNAVNTSLEHLTREAAMAQDGKYLDSAKRGVLRIGAIVENLADAANLEDSLADEDREVVDVQRIVESYVSNYGAMHSELKLRYQGDRTPQMACIADYRIEQVLDKLIDNAADFHRPDSPVTVQLKGRGDSVRLTIANRGPTLPKDVSLFESMASRRDTQNELHFGLGLYVVRVIAEQHGGSVSAVNLVDGSGVAVTVSLPIVNEMDRRALAA